MEELKFDFSEFDNMVSKIEADVGDLVTAQNVSLSCGESMSYSIDKLITLYDSLNLGLENYVLSLEEMIISLKQVKDTIFTIDDAPVNIIMNA
ncbi:MAG: hypothetical protein NC393_01235 [Clostridium sp.]|nr:hypothetical protein [Clostridium sp.]MCM1209124.1 hypothetical protein [Ruminococcus sp.]